MAPARKLLIALWKTRKGVRHRRERRSLAGTTSPRFRAVKSRRQKEALQTG